MNQQSHNQADSFFDAAEEVGYDSTPDSGVHESLQNMDPAQRARQEEELKNELAKTEEEIQTLRSVLAAKLRHSQDLKTKLGITVWREFRDDMEQGLKNVKESDVFQKTETVFKSAGEKTTTVLGTFGATVSKKIGEVKNSETFKSFEEKVGSAYTNVKTKVSGSRSNSMQSFDEALANAEGRTSSATTPATTPMIPEEKPLL